MYDSDICTLCNLDTRGDEYHYVVICKFKTKAEQMFYKTSLPHKIKFTKLEYLFYLSRRTTITRPTQFNLKNEPCLMYIN